MFVPRDNHPRARQKRQLARKKGTRPSYERILIVTEGTKTEPQYFEDIRKRNRIPSAHISVMPSELGTEPRQIVDFAEHTFLQRPAYERVYAVFDRDDHRTYNDALRRAGELNGRDKNDEGKRVKFTAIPSVPCFELWLLLHFEDVHAFWHRSETRERLNWYIPNYEKGALGIYDLTEQHLAVARQRAERLRTRFGAESGTDPFTKIDELVDFLRAIRRN